jgi:hypothetical protein
MEQERRKFWLFCEMSWQLAAWKVAENGRPIRQIRQSLLTQGDFGEIPSNNQNSLFQKGCPSA